MSWEPVDDEDEDVQAVVGKTYVDEPPSEEDFFRETPPARPNTLCREREAGVGLQGCRARRRATWST